MAVVTEREYNGHVICVCPAIFSGKAEAQLSIYPVVGKTEWQSPIKAEVPVFEADFYGTEAAILRRGEEEVDEIIRAQEDGD